MTRAAPLKEAARAGRDWLNGRLGAWAAGQFDPKMSEWVAGCDQRRTEAPLAALSALQDQPEMIASAWRGLGSLAYQMVAELKPRRVVELGSFGGYSTCALALGLRDFVPGATLDAVDTWQGDSHTGAYTERVLDQFQRLRRELGLMDIVRPRRMDFAAAAKVIPAGIELLHIDGWHTYAAVSHDFELYRPLLAPGAVVLFHDVASHYLGMRYFWWRLVKRFPAAAVDRSFGLGVIRIP